MPNPNGPEGCGYFQAVGGLYVPVPLGSLLVPVRSASLAGELNREIIGVMPTHKDLWGRELSLDEITERLAKIPFGACLDVCSRLIQVCEFRQASELQRQRLLKEVFSREIGCRYDTFLDQKPTENAVLMHPFPLLYLIKMSAVLSPVEPSQVELPQYIEPIIRLVYGVWGYLNQQAEGYPRRDADAVMYALAKRSMMGWAPFPWARAHGLYDVARPAVLEDRTTELGEISRQFLEVSGLSIPDLVYGTAWIYWYYQEGEIERFAREGKYLGPDRAFSSENVRIDEVARQLTCSVEQLRSECLAEQERSAGITESLVALKKHPLVRLPVGYRVCISPNLVAEAAVERPIRALESGAIEGKDGNAVNEVRRKFGVIFEDYVHWVFRRQFPYSYFLVPRDEKEERADGVIVDPRGIVIVECKAQRLVESQRYEIGNYTSALDALRRLKIGKAASQILATARALIAGALRLDGIRLTTPCPIGSLIVAYEDLPVSSVTARLFDPVLFETHLVRGYRTLKPQIIDVAEAEELPSICGTHTLLEILLKKDQDPKYGGEPLRLYAQRALGTRTRWDHNWTLAEGFLTGLQAQQTISPSRSQ